MAAMRLQLDKAAARYFSIVGEHTPRKGDMSKDCTLAAQILGEDAELLLDAFLYANYALLCFL